MLTTARLVGVLAAGSAIAGWRFIRAWRAAWATDAADCAIMEARTYTTDYYDD